MTPYEQGYSDILEKVAISPAMAQRALTNASNKLVAQKAPMSKIYDLFLKYLRTNARSQGIPRAEMPAAMQEIRNQFEYLKSLGVY